VVGFVPFAELGGSNRLAPFVGELGSKGAFANTGVAHNPEKT